MTTFEKIIFTVLVLSHIVLTVKVNNLIDVVYLMHTKTWQFMKGQNKGDGENRSN